MATTIMATTIPEPAYVKRFHPLESDPDLFTQLSRTLGLSPRYRFVDVLDLSSPPSNALSYVLAAPWIPSYESSHNAAEAARYSSLSAARKAQLETGAVWVRQTIIHACGFYAILHAVCNVPGTFTEGSFFDDVAKAQTPSERQKVVEGSQELEDAYRPISEMGQTRPPAEGVDPGNHYLTFVRRGGRTWELNGGRLGPIEREEGKSAEECLRERIRELEGHGRGFSVLALVDE